MASVWLRRAADRTAAEQGVLHQLLELSADAQAAYDLTNRFLQLVCEHRPAALDTWFENAVGKRLAGVSQFCNRTPA
jgi:hypothetical protein